MDTYTLCSLVDTLLWAHSHKASRPICTCEVKVQDWVLGELGSVVRSVNLGKSLCLCLRFLMPSPCRDNSQSVPASASCPGNVERGTSLCGKQDPPTMKGFIGQYQNMEGEPEARWKPVCSLEHWCNTFLVREAE